MFRPAPHHNFISLGGRRYRLLGWEDREAVVVSHDEDHSIATHQTIKADPGWFVLTWDDKAENDDDAFFKEPIIAWEIEHCSAQSLHTDKGGYEHTSYWVHPITPSGTSDGDDFLAPDGLVYGASWVGATIEQYKAGNASSRKQT